MIEDMTIPFLKTCFIRSEGTCQLYLKTPYLKTFCLNAKYARIARHSKMQKKAEDASKKLQSVRKSKMCENCR